MYTLPVKEPFRTAAIWMGLARPSQFINVQISYATPIPYTGCINNNKIYGASTSGAFCPPICRIHHAIVAFTSGATETARTAHLYTRAHTNRHAHTLTRTHIHTHLHTHIHIRTHTLSHTHTHLQAHRGPSSVEALARRDATEAAGPEPT